MWYFVSQKITKELKGMTKPFRIDESFKCCFAVVRVGTYVCTTVQHGFSEVSFCLTRISLHVYVFWQQWIVKRDWNQLHQKSNRTTSYTVSWCKFARVHISYFIFQEVALELNRIPTIMHHRSRYFTHDKKEPLFSIAKIFYLTEDTFSCLH